MWTIIKECLDILGYISTVIVIISFLWAVSLWFRGIMPVLLRLGHGLSRRKIALFGRGDNLISLKNLMHDSKIFDLVSILEIPNMSDIGIAEDATLFLVYWPDWKDEIEKILNQKPDGTALVLYAPQEHGFIPQQVMHMLEQHRNVIVNNFRGRLLNDVVIAMITTGYSRK